jgi:hypothetical protein
MPVSHLTGAEWTNHSERLSVTRCRVMCGPGMRHALTPPITLAALRPGSTMTCNGRDAGQNDHGEREGRR